MTAYVVARNAGFGPIGAARRATAVVAAVLLRRMIAIVSTADGAFAVDLETEEVEPYDGTLEPVEVPILNLPRLVAAAAAGATVLAVVDTKPPLVVSHDAGTTWRESGRGLPAGRAVAISDGGAGHRGLRRSQPSLRDARRRRLLDRARRRATGDRGLRLRS